MDFQSDETDSPVACDKEVQEELLYKEGHAESETHLKYILESLASLKINGKYCDVTIQIGEETMAAHRLVLIAASKYFETMFSLQMKESETSVIEFRESPPEVIRTCIEFIYSGKANFSTKDPEIFIQNSEIMQLHHLTNMYFEFLIEQIDSQNCFEYLELADKHSKDDCKKLILKFICGTLENLLESEDFASLSLSLLKAILKNFTPSEKSESLKWRAIITWVGADLDSRKPDFQEIFQLVDLLYLPKAYIRDHVHGCKLIENSVLLDWVSSATLSDDYPKKSESVTHILKCNSEETRVLLQYDVEHDRWSRFGMLPSNVVFSKVRNLDIFSLNGLVHVCDAKSLHRFQEGKWQKLYDGVRYSPCYNRCVAIGDLIYIVTKSYAVELNYKTLASSYTNFNLELGEGFFVARAGKKFYAYGGDEYKKSKTAIEFDLMSKACHRIRDLPSEGYSGFCYRDKIYAVSCGQIHVYEPGVDTWCRATDFCNRYSSTPQNCYISDNFLHIVFANEISRIPLKKFEMTEDCKKMTKNMNWYNGHIACFNKTV